MYDQQRSNYFCLLRGGHRNPLCNRSLVSNRTWLAIHAQTCKPCQNQSELHAKLVARILPIELDFTGSDWTPNTIYTDLYTLCRRDRTPLIEGTRSSHTQQVNPGLNLCFPRPRPALQTAKCNDAARFNSLSVTGGDLVRDVASLGRIKIANDPELEGSLAVLGLTVVGPYCDRSRRNRSPP